MIGENAVEPARAATVDRVADEAPLAFLITSKRTMRRELLEIGLARIDALEIVFDFVVRRGSSLIAAARFSMSLRDFRQRGSAFRAGKFQAVVVGRIVAGGDVDAAVELAVNDGVRDRRSGRRLFAQENPAAVCDSQNGRGRECEFLGEESRVVADDQRRLFLLRENVSGNRGRQRAARPKT